MVISFILVLLLCGSLYFLSQGIYDNYVAPLDKDEYRLKSFIPMGLYILEKVNYRYSTKYDMRLMSKLAELNGGKYAKYYLQIHMANKLAIVSFVLVVMLFFGVLANSGIDSQFAVFLGFVILISFFITDVELDKKIKDRRLALMVQFPEFLNKLTLLINAGMTLTKAWERIVCGNKKNTVLYNELEFTAIRIRSGMSEIVAYEEFAARCRIPEITKFVSLVIQNLRRGNAEIVNIFKFQAIECWEMRKHAAKRIGEEASTKMVLPMAIMFFAIIIIVITPAVLSLRGG